jgi:pimeloyl-ACP methyl ester carboxylesterase
MRRTNLRAAGIGLAFVAGLAAAGRLAEFRRDLRAARERVREGSRLARTAVGPIEFAEAGERAPVLVVHGAGGGIDQGLDLGKPLAARGFRVVAMSRFGYLRTPMRADASPEAQADAHAALLDALGIARAAIIGASAGAPSALQFVLRHPQRCSALVLMVPALHVPRPDGEPSRLPAPALTQLVFDTALRSDLLFWLAIRHAKRLVVRSLLATPPEVVDAAEPDEQERVMQTLEHILPVSERRLGLLNDARVTSTLRRAPLEQVEARTLAIGAADDLFGTYEAARYAAEHVPGARFLGFETGGHVVVGHQRGLIEEIARFLISGAR